MPFPIGPSRRSLLLLGAGLSPALFLGRHSRELSAVGPLPIAPADPLAWVRETSCMAFATPGEVTAVADAGAQVLHTNIVWPYHPLRKDGGGLAKADSDALRRLVRACQTRRVRVSLGLPPFMPVELARLRPEWREHRDDTGRLPPVNNDLGTRSGCNLGPWGDYLIELCAELAADHELDGFSFDGNYHPSLCYCPACKQTYRAERNRDLPRTADLGQIAYREYLVWRGEKLTDHYRRMRDALRRARPGAALMSWTVNAGRWGHFLHSPRAMPVEVNRVFDLPMQEWWLDETNQGGSIAPAFGAAYLRAVAGDGPCASEPYLMSRGNPYGTDSFPHHERMARTLLALTHGNAGAHSFGWPGHRDSTREVFAAVRARRPWLTQTRRAPWAGLLVSEATRQFVAYADIAGRYLPHPLGAFRACMEEHLAVSLLTDADVSERELRSFAVLVLPGAVALSDRQVAAIRAFVRDGGGLVATGETSLCDELGRPRKDFALADVFGVSYRGAVAPAAKKRDLDPNFAIALDDAYWRERTGVARLQWSDHALVGDARLQRLVPTRSVTFRGPLTAVSEPAAGERAVALSVEGRPGQTLPGVIARTFGKGRVVYLAAALDAALWNYAYPYQRRLFAGAMERVARVPQPIRVLAPMCVQATFFTQQVGHSTRRVVHLFNNINTTAHHGRPGTEVPLREETVAIADVRVQFIDAPSRVWLQPEGRALPVRREGGMATVVVPRLELHALVVAE